MTSEKRVPAALPVSTENTANVVNLHSEIPVAMAQRNRQEFFARAAQRMRDIELEHFGSDMGALALFGNNLDDYLPSNQPTQSDISEDALDCTFHPGAD